MNSVVDSLNRLATATSDRNGHLGFVAPSAMRPTSVQGAVLDRLSASVRRSGRCPPDLDPSRALRELMRTKDLYSQEPQHLATYDAKALKILHTTTCPKRAETLLPPAAAEFLRRPVMLEKSTEELEQTLLHDSMPRPFWDQGLARSPRRLESFLRQLFHRGMLSFRSAIKAEVGLFFVKKKEDQIRLIIDARQANFCHRPPPRTCLGSAGAMTELSLPARLATDSGAAELFVTTSAADVDDSFYQYLVPSVAAWFGIRRLARALTRGAAGASGTTRFRPTALSCPGRCSSP